MSNYITKKHLNRRTVLRGLGAVVGLPLLESMVPAQTPLLRTAASPKSRLSCIYVPHGATMDKWTPSAVGKAFELTESLQPLEKVRDRINIISDAGADHARSAAVFLSGAHPEKDSIRVGTTVDQIAALRIGQDTPLPSLELSVEEVALSCGSGYACAYSNTISWKTPTVPLPMENNPQVVFEKLFGDGANTQDRQARKQLGRSLLDSVMQEAASLLKELPASDRAKLSGYLEDVREIERRIEKAEKAVPANLTLPEAPVGVPESFDEHFKLMFDLETLAFRADITRVATLMYARDTSGSVYPQSGVREGFHVASHHSNGRAAMDRFALINKYHVQMLAYFLEKLKSTPDGDGTLLDHSMVLYGSSMSNGNQHDHDPLPILLAGGASGRLTGNRHIKMPEHTPMSNLLLGMLNLLDVNADKHGDSTGILSL